MSTRGMVGFISKGKIKGWYNRSDSYPDGLGSEVCAKFAVLTKKQIKEFFTKKLTLIEDNKYMIGEDPFYEFHKGIMDADWTKGKYKLEDGSNFIEDALFCEHAYIFDLDKGSLLYFVGFARKPDKRFPKLTCKPDHKEQQWYQKLLCEISYDKRKRGYLILEKAYKAHHKNKD